MVTDVDGTLTDHDRKLDLGTIEVIRRLGKAGIPTVLASGNAYPVVLYLAKYMGIDAPIVAENGGVVAWETKNIKLVLGSRDGPYEFFMELRDRYGLLPLTSDSWRESEVVLDRNVDYEILSSLAGKAGLTVEDTKFAYHISQTGIGKYSGVREALGLLGLDPRNALAVGDSQNDLEMIRECGIGAAVGNATDDAKKAARIISPRSFGAGFIDIITGLFPDLNIP